MMKRQKSWGELKEFKNINIFIAKQEAECLKELKRQKEEYFKKMKRQKSWRGLKDFKKCNIFIAEHDVECLKELKRQEDEKEPEKVKKLQIKRVEWA